MQVVRFKQKTRKKRLSDIHLVLEGMRVWLRRAEWNLDVSGLTDEQKAYHQGVHRTLK